MPYILEWYTETQQQTLAELKLRYDQANEGKLNKENIMNGLLEELDKSYKVLADMLIQTKKCKERLGEIAMRPNALPSVEYLRMMIENEKNNRQQGWQDRVTILQKLSTQSQLLQDAGDPEFSQKLFAEYTKDSKMKGVLCKVKPNRHQDRSWAWFWWRS